MVDGIKRVTEFEENECLMNSIVLKEVKKFFTSPDILESSIYYSKLQLELQFNSFLALENDRRQEQ